jgi:hypothetical protein
LAVVVGVALAYTLTVLNGAEREERAWSWGGEIIYLVLLALWCLGSVAFVLPGDRTGRRRWRLAWTIVPVLAVAGWLAVLGEALRHPK